MQRSFWFMAADLLQDTGIPAAPNKRHTCQWLESRITQLDSMARAGGPAQYLDWMAGERKKARDEQFRLRC